MKIIILLLAIGSYGKIISQKPAIVISDKSGWHKIGETTVDFKRDRDEIVIMGADRFSFIKFKITDAPIDLSDIEIHYENNAIENIKIGSSIKHPGESRVINLNGERYLRKIIYMYKTLPNPKNEKAHIEIWGLKTQVGKK